MADAPLKPADTAPARRTVTARVTPDEHQRILAAAASRSVSVEELLRAGVRDVLDPPAPKS